MFLMLHELMFLYISCSSFRVLSRSVFSTCHLGNTEVCVCADNIYSYDLWTYAYKLVRRFMYLEEIHYETINYWWVGKVRLTLFFVMKWNSIIGVYCLASKLGWNLGYSKVYSWFDIEYWVIHVFQLTGLFCYLS